MSTKYTPLDGTGTETSPPVLGTTPPGYELDDFTPIIPEAGSSQSLSEPLDVVFHGENGGDRFKLKYDPQSGVSGIHQAILSKLDSMGIQIEEGMYLIGVWDGSRFRLITSDYDRISQRVDSESEAKVHYFKTDEKASITEKRNHDDSVCCTIASVIIVTVLILLILFFVWLKS